MIKVSEKKVINDIRGTYEGKNRIENRGEKYKSEVNGYMWQIGKMYLKEQKKAY